MSAITLDRMKNSLVQLLSPLSIEARRIELNKSIHLTPISYTALKAVLQDPEILTPNLYEVFKEKLIKEAKGTFTLSSSIPALIKRINIAINNGTIKGKNYFLIMEGENPIAAISNSYENLQSSLFRNIINTTLNETTSSKKFQAGHTYIPNSGINVSPISSIVETGLSELQSFATSGYANLELPRVEESRVASKIRKLPVDLEIAGKYATTSINNILHELNNSENSLANTHERSKNLATVSIYKTISEIAASIEAIIVIPQDSYENGTIYAKKELAVIRNIRTYIQESLSNLAQSPTLEEELVIKVVGAITGTKPKKVSKTSKIIIPKPIKKPGVTISKIPSITTRLKSFSGKFQSVTSLKTLLNSRLFGQIRKNMASPTLNYRTGRFAESVKLKDIQYDNRNNTIVAFLSYMRYPYATFEPGGRQGSIQRSPRLLIDKTIRELALELTKARMKTIIV